MSHYYHHQFIKIENSDKYYFIAESFNYGSEDEYREPGSLNLANVEMISGPYKDLDTVADEMVRLCGNPGGFNGTSVEDEDSLTVRVLKNQLGDKSFPVKKTFRHGEFAEIYWAIFDENRANSMKM